MQAHPQHHTRVLFRHEPHPQLHIPQKVTIAKAEQALTGFNMKIAVAITNGLGTMVCAYIFAILAIIGFPGFRATSTQYVQWVSQTFIQLVALSVLAVGQQVPRDAQRDSSKQAEK
jgi:ABC-type amino acid transport system permease subunit